MSLLLHKVYYETALGGATAHRCSGVEGLMNRPVVCSSDAHDPLPAMGDYDNPVRTPAPANS